MLITGETVYLYDLWILTYYDGLNILCIVCSNDPHPHDLYIYRVSQNRRLNLIVYINYLTSDFKEAQKSRS